MFNSALITGASGRIGASIARALTRRGVKELVLVAERRNALETLAGELAREGVSATVEALDLSSLSDLNKLIENYTSFDLIVHAADLLRCGKVKPDQIVTAHCVALTLINSAFIPKMKEKGLGGILFVGSSEAFIPNHQCPEYTASMAFMMSYSESLRIQLKNSGILISALIHNDEHKLTWEQAPRAPLDRAIQDWLENKPISMSARLRLVSILPKKARTLI